MLSLCDFVSQESSLVRMPDATTINTKQFPNMSFGIDSYLSWLQYQSIILRLASAMRNDDTDQGWKANFGLLVVVQYYNWSLHPKVFSYGSMVRYLRSGTLRLLTSKVALVWLPKTDDVFKSLLECDCRRPMMLYAVSAKFSCNWFILLFDNSTLCVTIFLLPSR